MLSNKKIQPMRLDCPANLMIQIRSEPTAKGIITGHVKSGSIIEVKVKESKGFYELADGSGFINKNTTRVQWTLITEPESIDKIDLPLNAVTESLNNLMMTVDKESWTSSILNDPDINVTLSNTSNNHPNPQEAFLALLRGDFSAFSTASKLVPKSKLCIFVSSTFTDTKKERDWLIEDLLPVLQERGRRYGILVTLADMRFGIKDESTKDHDTWTVCAKQLKYCYDESDGLFFLSLQSDKYGYMPLPKQLTPSVVDPIIVNWTGELQLLFREWYVLDDSAVPKEYVLKSLQDTNDPAYWAAFPKLHIGLAGVSFADESYGQLITGTSVTEWELRYALALARGEDRCAWVWRRFNDDVTTNQSIDQSLLKNYCDFATQSAEAQSIRAKHTDLIRTMQSGIRADRVTNVSAPDFAEYTSNEKSTSCTQGFLQYESDYMTSMRELLNSELDSVIHKVSVWKLDGNGLYTSGDELNEMLHHYKIAIDKCSTFQGRAQLLDQALDMIQANHITSTTMNVCLSVIGVSGAGKTALMAKLAQECVSRRLFPADVPVIVRFCGTSRGSVDGLGIVSSICRQILLCYNIHDESVPSDYVGAVELFHKLILEYPVAVFIDSLDQLTDANFARSKLSFLVGLKCHPSSRVIVSALPDEKEVNSNKWKYIYLCDTRLKEANVDRITIVNFEDARVEAETILVSMLKLHGRSLQPSSLRYVLDQVMVEPTALYLNLAVLVVSQWTSSMSVGVMIEIKATVQNLINQIFDSLEMVYGKHLTRQAVGFLTFAKAGVSDVELQDLLSLCDEVLDELFVYWQPSKYKRVPLSVVLRLREAMQGLLVERAGGCLSWYHRQIRETAECRYKNAQAPLLGQLLVHERVELLHEKMGIYFVGDVSENLSTGRLISKQNLVLDNSSIWFVPESDILSKINYRRCVEGLHHLARAGSSSSVLEYGVQQACVLEVICASIMVGEGFALVGNVSLLEQTAVASAYQSPRLTHFARWLRQDMSSMAQNIKVAKLWVNTSAITQPKCSEARQDMQSLLDRTSSSTIKFTASPDALTSSRCWIRSRSMGGRLDFDAYLVTLVGHTSGVNSVCMSSDGSRIISGSGDNTVRVWDAVSGANVLTLEGHTSSVSCVSLSPDGFSIISGSADNSMKVWDTVSGVHISTLEGHTDQVNSLCVSPDGSRIISGSDDKTVKVWNAVSGICVLTLEGHSKLVSCVCLSPDGSRIISGSMDKTVRIWDAVSGARVLTLKGHTKPVSCICISPDGFRVISGSEGKAVRVWDAVSGACLLTLEGHTWNVSCVCMSPDGSRIISGSWDKSVRVWDAVSGACVLTLEGHTAPVYSVCASPDGFSIISGSDDSTMRVWDAMEGACMSTLEDHTDQVSCVCLSPDGSRTISGSDDNTVKIWNAVSGACLLTLEGHTDQVSCVCLSPDGSRIISGSWDKTVRVWDIVSGTCMSTLIGHTEEVCSVCICPDGSRIISGSMDKTVRVWDAVSGAIILTLEGHTSSVSCVYISHGGTRVISGSWDNTVRVWDIVSDRNILTLVGHTSPVTSVCVSLDGSRIISGSDDNTVRVWNTVSGACVSTLEGHIQPVSCVCLSHDGTRIISGSWDKTIRVWDAVFGAYLFTLEGHTSSVTSVCVSSDGSRIISGSWDKTVRVWDAVNSH